MAVLQLFKGKNNILNRTPCMYFRSQKVLLPSSYSCKINETISHLKEDKPDHLFAKKNYQIPTYLYLVFEILSFELSLTALQILKMTGVKQDKVLNILAFFDVSLNGSFALIFGQRVKEYSKSSFTKNEFYSTAFFCLIDIYSPLSNRFY